MESRCNVVEVVVARRVRNDRVTVLEHQANAGDTHVAELCTAPLLRPAPASAQRRARLSEHATDDRAALGEHTAAKIHFRGRHVRADASRTRGERAVDSVAEHCRGTDAHAIGEHRAGARREVADRELEPRSGHPGRIINRPTVEARRAAQHAESGGEHVFDHDVRDDRVAAIADHDRVLNDVGDLCRLRRHGFSDIER
jgi:hypothetical protein